MSRIFVLLVLFSSNSWAVGVKFRAETNSRFLYHTNSPLDVASHRHSLELEGSLKDGPFWTFHAGAKAYTEGAYASNESRYGADLRRRESQDLRLKDAYIQYKSGGWTVRAGNQQIVWGEAFGFYYADLVNPKDLRELGIGSVEKNRLSIPILSTKFVFDEYSMQGFVIPKPYFNLMPAEGGDFSFPFDRFFPGVSTTHYESDSLGISSENVEGGVRGSGRLGPWDLSLFFASYNDRNPSYSSTYNSASSVDLRDIHDRLSTFGGTSSVPCGPFICRAEILWNRSKSFTTFQLPDLVSMKSDEYVGVFGIDYTESDKNHLSLQVSETLRALELAGAIASRSQQNISFHVKMATFSNQRIETVLSFIPNDHSVLVQAQYLIPISERIELLLMGDTFFGESTSQFGQFKQASRVGTFLKIYLTSES